MASSEPTAGAAARDTLSQEPPYPRPTYAWYVVGVLMIIYVFSFIDRQILNLLVGPIRRDLEISDTQMSYLMGFSFAVFYTFFGIPLGRIADSKSRRGLIAVGLVIWSATTAACGLAQRYWQFLLLRMGVGVGEAALSPAAYSLITDSFPRKRLATAISVYSMGIYLGSGMAFLLGGIVVGIASGQETWDLPVVGATRPWQIVFFAVGLPGIALSLLLLTVKEPLRRGLRRVGGKQVTGAPLSEVIAFMRSNTAAILCHNVGFALLSFSSYGASAWIPTFLQRHYNMSARDSGIAYGTIVMVAGSLGIVVGGRLADWLVQRGYRDAKLRAGLIASLAWFPTGCLYVLMPTSTWSLALLVPTVFTVSMPFGCAAAAIQEIMPNSMRGQASAIYLFVVNLIGLGLGPSAVAWCTDYLFKDDLDVGYSLLLVAVVAHIASTIILAAGLRPYRKSLDRLDGYLATNT